MKLASLIEENEQRARAPALTIQEYIKQLADRGDVQKIQMLHSATYGQISTLTYRA